VPRDRTTARGADRDPGPAGVDRVLSQGPHVHRPRV